MYKKLNEFCENRELMAIYANPRDSECYVIGYILKIDDNALLFENVS